MDITQFRLDENKCIGCGTCTKVCCGEILSVDEKGKARIAPVTEFGWAGCWECQHCLAVCPTGAISIFGRKPEDSLPAPEPEQAAPVLDALLTTRRACRRYLQKDVPMEAIEGMFTVLQNLPTGSNRCVMMTFPRVVLELMPGIYALLGIPGDHYVGPLMGFGWPELHYPRGVQRQGCAQLQRPVIPEASA